MRQFDQAGSLGALLLGSALLGYAIYEVVLWPNAGFPTNEIEVILAGAPTLRIGHWLKFADAIALALLVVAMHARLRQATPALAQLAAIGGAGAATLFLASGMLGLRILAVGALFLVNSGLSYELTLIAAVLAMVWSFWLAAVLWREAKSSESLAPARA